MCFKAIRDSFKKSDRYKAVVDAALSETTGPRGGKLYDCFMCNEPCKQFDLDHQPITVVPFELYYYQVDVYDYYNRVFTLNVELVCKKCHKNKTAAERKLRRAAKMSSVPCS